MARRYRLAVTIRLGRTWEDWKHNEGRSRELLKIERQGRVTVAMQCKCGRGFTTRQRIQALCPKCEAAKEGYAAASQ